MTAAAQPRTGRSMRGLKATVEAAHGAYSLTSPDGAASLKNASITVKANHQWLSAQDYSKPTVKEISFRGELGSGHAWTVTYSGDAQRPTLRYELRVYANRPFADLQVTVLNSTAQALTVQDMRPVSAEAASALNLGGPEAEERVLSDSFSEDRPEMQIRDFDNPKDQMHLGVGSQLIYNRASGQSLFFGTLTSNKFLTILRLHVAGDGADTHFASFEVDNAGTTELTRDYSLRHAPQDDLVELSVPVAPGHALSSERLLVSLAKDYHAQLETYGGIIHTLHHARVSPPPPMGWWSWTAYYAQLTQQEALTDAKWMAANLKSDGYKYFHVDEGYSVARGDYLTPMSSRFPDGMEKFEKKLQALGLTPAIWTAPFEVSDQAWVYQHHKDWLLHDYAGKPIQLTGSHMPGGQAIYVIDSTNPGAQAYLRKTYSTMAKQWGIRAIKLDFMEDSCIEGKYYRAGTTALEAQRIGLGIIRSAVGDGVLLDKDGSVMLNPVGLVDMGRISQDTSHRFHGIKAAATGIAARYYMNHNFFLTDPDAFMISRGEGNRVLSLDEAKVSIALAAVAGGMFEIGDKLPELAAEPERLALLKNPDLLAMVHLSKASFPVDLMTYRPEDLQPSVFLLKENARQSMLTVFNWTDDARTHNILLSEIGLKPDGNYTMQNILDGKQIQRCKGCEIPLNLAPHSVAMIKIVQEGAAGSRSHQ
ncbi:MAG TPA: glycoside hydrolase family 36 protein [Terracidiphilus sp.]|nr:glycoside hydrolase family 36 protein [Terracidiphilus sp.]